MKLRAVFRFIRETNNSLLIILPGLLFSLGLAQFAMILFVFFQSPKANLLLLAIVVLNLLIFSLFIVFIIHITTAFIQPLYEIWHYSISPDSKKRLSDNPFLQRVEEQVVAQTDEIIKSQFGNITNLKALQSQINPHFLYNTLDSLRGELYMCDMPNLAQMVETLSELFRYSISQKEPLISLEAEIDNTEKYIRIMQFRFPNKFVLYKRFDDATDEILGMQVPKMILQPIVENSINHGLEAKIGPARKFMAAPAAKMISFFQKPWRFSAAGSSESSSSPSMAQKPPTGKARREYWVSPRCFFHSTGPMPMANSLTRTPQALAARKCPSSWTAIKIPNTSRAAMIYTIMYASSFSGCHRAARRDALSASSISARPG